MHLNIIRIREVIQYRIVQGRQYVLKKSLGWRPYFPFLYLFLFQSPLCSTPFLSPNKQEKKVTSIKELHGCSPCLCKCVLQRKRKFASPGPHSQSQISDRQVRFAVCCFATVHLSLFPLTFSLEWQVQIRSPFSRPFGYQSRRKRWAIVHTWMCSLSEKKVCVIMPLTGHALQLQLAVSRVDIVHAFSTVSSDHLWSFFADISKHIIKKPSVDPQKIVCTSSFTKRISCEKCAKMSTRSLICFWFT